MGGEPDLSGRSAAQSTTHRRVRAHRVKGGRGFMFSLLRRYVLRGGEAWTSKLLRKSPANFLKQVHGNRCYPMKVEKLNPYTSSFRLTLPKSCHFKKSEAL